MISAAPRSDLGTILVIDDSPLARAIAQQTLEAAGFRVTTAPDGRAGLAAAASSPPDLVLCDLIMPQMDGLEVLRGLQRQSPAIPVLIFTDDSAVETAVEAMRRGAAGYVIKGAGDGDLVAEVQTALRRQRADSQRRAQLDRLTTLGTIAAGVAHEINTPLGYVRANLTLLKSMLDATSQTHPLDSEERSEAAEALRDALQGVDRMARIVRDMKSLSRQGGDDHPVDLHEVLESATRMAVAAIREKARFTSQLGDLPIVLGDAGRLAQVFINLLVNAAQAIPAGDVRGNEVRLIARTDAEGGAVVEVHDTGSGIPEEARRHLFEPFFTTKPAGVGTGLGLSISQSIVATHGGHISVESAAGRGAVFCVRLPAATATPATLALAG